MSICPSYINSLPSGIYGKAVQYVLNGEKEEDLDWEDDNSSVASVQSSGTAASSVAARAPTFASPIKTPRAKKPEPRPKKPEP